MTSLTQNMQRFREFWMLMHNYVSLSMAAIFPKPAPFNVIIPKREYNCVSARQHSVNSSSGCQKTLIYSGHLFNMTACCVHSKQLAVIAIARSGICLYKPDCYFGILHNRNKDC